VFVEPLPYPVSALKPPKTPQKCLADAKLAFLGAEERSPVVNRFLFGDRTSLWHWK
jgi:hypothetical protein